MQEVKVSTSKQFQINWRDVIRGALFTTISTILLTVYNAISLPGGFKNIDWAELGATAASIFIGYIIKNFFEPTKTVIVTDPKNAELTMQTMVEVKKEANKQRIGDGETGSPLN